MSTNRSIWQRTQSRCVHRALGQRKLCSHEIQAQAHSQPQINNGLQNQYREVLSTYWQATLRRLEDDDHDYKVHQLPLARIKKVMKADADVKMISAEAPILFAKGCDIFITELTMRAWIHAEENKRRTLQRSDIAAALAKSDMYDFLIDIVPREEAGPANQKRPSQASQANQQSIPPQVPQQMGGPHHHAPPQEYAGYPGHLAGEQEFRGPPMYAPQDQAYGHPPPGMFEQNMYNQYQMPAPQVRA